MQLNGQMAGANVRSRLYTLLLQWWPGVWLITASNHIGPCLTMSCKRKIVISKT